MTNKWNYNDAYKRYPLTEQPYIFPDGSIVQVHDIFDPLPEFMKQADILFVDPPWNLSNINTFYMKADKAERIGEYGKFYKRLFDCIEEINPHTCYVEIGKEHLADFVLEMRSLFKYVTFYNSFYYHDKNKICYVVRGSMKFKNRNLIIWMKKTL